MSYTYAIIGCGKLKREVRCPARELYCGNLFEAARDYVESRKLPYWILSGEHQLVSPYKELAPYDLHINDLTKEEKLIWGALCNVDLVNKVPRNGNCLFLAGEAYWKEIEVYLKGYAATIDRPLAGLGIGQQLSWLRINKGRHKPQ